MQAHPVPQNIMQVEFQLVGNLTLRQFGYLASAGIVAWLIFITPLVIFIRLPLAVLVAGFGLALAFLPINDIKLEKWLVAFFKAIYSPTKRVWLKEPKTVDFLSDRFASMVYRPTANFVPRTTNRAKLDLYLSSHKSAVQNQFDELEERRIQTLDFNISVPQGLASSPDMAPKELALSPEAAAPRVIEEASVVSKDQIASRVVFKPITTIKLPDKNRFIKAVSNKRLHSLNPKAALHGTIVLPVRGEKIFQASEGLKEKLSRYISKPKPPSPAMPRPEVLVAEKSALPEAVASHVATTPAPTVTTQTHTPPAPMSPVHQPPTPVLPPAPKPTAAPLYQPPPVLRRTEPLPIPPKPEPPRTVVSHLPPIIRAQTVNVTNITNLGAKPTVSDFHKPTTPTPPRVSPPPELLIPVRENQPPLPPVDVNPNPPAEDPMANNLNEKLKDLTTTESRLKGEVERYRAEASRLESRLHQEENRSTGGSQGQRIQELQEELVKMQHEKTLAEDRIRKMENLITQINTTQPRQRDVITPQPAQITPKAPLQTVPPRLAEGKMAPPMTTVPNVINGVVKDVNGLLLPDTIIVVKDNNDEPVRALKTNKIGQFAITTALPNGTYLMEIEKENYEFDLVEIKLTGELLAPIEIRSRNGGSNG